MTKQELYLTIFQAIGNPNANAQLLCVTDFDRDIAVNVARNSGGNISHITMEFIGVRSRFLCSILFDGNGDQDTCFANFAMPKVKLNGKQRSIVMIACLDFLIDNGVIDASPSYFAERIVPEHGAHPFALRQYAQLRFAAKSYIEKHPEYLRHETSEPLINSSQYAF